MFLIGIGIYYYQYTSPTFHDDYTVSVSKQKQKEIIKELKQNISYIEEVKNHDSMNGYTLSTGTPSLSKNGIKKIIDHLKTKNICIKDYQGYFNLVNPNIFTHFYNEYSNHKATSFILYSITQTGEIERQEFICDNHVYVLTTTYSMENGKMTNIETFGHSIDNLQYDNNFFTYHMLNEEYLKRFNIVDTFYIRIKPIDEQLRLLNQKYIEPFGYYCHNLFTSNWNENHLNTVNFNDLIEYLYSIDTDQPFSSDLYKNSDQPFIQRIDRQFYEKLIQKYFQIKTTDLRKWNLYDKKTNSYPYTEVYCVASKFEQPSIKSEVEHVEYNGNLMILTVNAVGYELGYPIAFTHKITIRKTKKGIQYVSNQILDSKNNHIPKYTPGITCETLKKGL